MTESRALIRGLMSDVIRKCCHVTSNCTGHTDIRNNEDSLEETLLLLVVCGFVVVQ